MPANQIRLDSLCLVVVGYVFLKIFRSEKMSFFGFSNPIALACLSMYISFYTRLSCGVSTIRAKCMFHFNKLKLLLWYNLLLNTFQTDYDSSTLHRIHFGNNILHLISFRGQLQKKDSNNTM